MPRERSGMASFHSIPLRLSLPRHRQSLRSIDAVLDKVIGAALDEQSLTDEEDTLSRSASVHSRRCIASDCH